MSTTNCFKVGKLQITTPVDWLDITDEVEVNDPPFTLAKSTGVGVIQFSTAEYRHGKIPKITVNDLRSLLADFARSRELGPCHGFSSQERPLLIAAGNFDFEHAFLRVWYCSDGQNVALVTYNCERDQQRAELSDCEAIVHNLKFEM